MFRAETSLLVVNLAVDFQWLRLRVQGILSKNGCRYESMDVWQRAVDTERFSPAYRSEQWRRRITDGHPERVVLTYVGRLGAGTPPHYKHPKRVLESLGFQDKCPTCVPHLVNEVMHGHNCWSLASLKGVRASTCVFARLEGAILVLVCCASHLYPSEGLNPRL